MSPLFGASVKRELTVLTFIGTSTFSHNSAHYDGGAVVTASDAVFSMSGTINNSANNGGAILAVVNPSVSFAGTSSFISNSVMQGGAISVNSNSKLVFNKSFTFTNNGEEAVRVQCIWLLVQFSRSCPTRVCVGRTIMHV